MTDGLEMRHVRSLNLDLRQMWDHLKMLDPPAVWGKDDQREGASEQRPCSPLCWSPPEFSKATDRLSLLEDYAQILKVAH